LARGARRTTPTKSNSCGTKAKLDTAVAKLPPKAHAAMAEYTFVALLFGAGYIANTVTDVLPPGTPQRSGLLALAGL
jgi:hypothetical protein